MLIKVFFILIIFFIVLFIALFITSIITFKNFSYPEVRTLDETLRLSYEKKEFNEDFFKNDKITYFTVMSNYGYNLNGFYINNESNKTIIFVHGHTYTYHGVIKYMEYFIKNGFNVLTYNQRAHGDSGGKGITGGYYEKYDLQKIIDYAYQIFNKTEKLILFGSSMGGAVVLQTGELDKRISLIIADSPYSDLKKLLLYHLRLRKLPDFISNLILNIVNFLFIINFKCRISDVSPINSIMNTSIPIVLIHGEADTFVLPDMSKEMYSKRREKFPTELVTVPEAKHVSSIIVNKEFYLSKLDEFLKKYDF